MTQHLDTQTAQLLAHLRRGGTYSYFWAASQQKDSRGDALWKCTYWQNRTGAEALAAGQHQQYGAVDLYFGVNPMLRIPQERKNKSGTTYRPHPGNVRPLVEEISALNCLYAEYDAEDFGDNLESHRRAS